MLAVVVRRVVAVVVNGNDFASTVYREQPAQADGERVVACICMITGAFLFAYIVGSVCNIATSLSADTNEYAVWDISLAGV